MLPAHLALPLQDGGYDPMAQFVGNELFPSFESSLFGEGDLGGGHGGGGASLTVAQDISELFGSRWGGPEGEERFEVDGDAMERRFRWAPRLEGPGWSDQTSKASRRGCCAIKPSCHAGLGLRLCGQDSTGQEAASLGRAHSTCRWLRAEQAFCRGLRLALDTRTRC